MRKLTIPFVISVLALLAACSPHPGAGMWVAAQQNAGEFSRLNVTYEGRTNFYDWMSDPASDSDATAVRRCFWHGVDPQTIEMTCVQAANTELEETYRLRVTAERNEAELLQDSRIVAKFVRSTANR